MRALLNGFLAFLLPLLLAGMAYLYFESYIHRYGPEHNVSVIIPKGAGMKEIATTMAREGYGPQPLFKLMALRYGVYGRLRAGEYLFPYGATPYDVMMKMAHGEVVLHSFTVPEGWTTAKVIEALKAIAPLTGEAGEASFKEGELLPETYQFVYGDTRPALLMRMHRAMEAELQKAMQLSSSAPPALDPQQLLTLASIVEKETGKPEERPRVAAVYLNRLKSGIRLQADPTVIYALTQGKGDLGRPLLLADLTTDSPYNTYRNTGLPPGPICNPGKASIAAVAHPLQTDELYFVADGSGGHRFAKTEKEHAENVAKFRVWEAKNSHPAAK